MATSEEILNEIQINNVLQNKINRYMCSLEKLTKRNVVVYFSSWQQNAVAFPNSNFGIDDNDRNGFMSALCGLDKNKGLDLILHTPGGDLTATKSIVEYLYQFFNGDIRVIVPHTAMSAGTMIACAGREIIMGLHSTLGPIDPQIGSIPANEFLKFFNKALDEIDNNINMKYWSNVLFKYPPTFFGQCQNAIDLSKKYVGTWLKRSMLKDVEDSLVKKTVEYLADYNYHLEHSTRLHINELRDNTDLAIINLEGNQGFQDLVLSIFHCFVILVSNNPYAKIISNSKNKIFCVDVPK